MHLTARLAINSVAEFYELEGEPEEAEAYYLSVFETFADVRNKDCELIRMALGRLALMHMLQNRSCNVENLAKRIGVEVKCTCEQHSADVTGQEWGASESRLGNLCMSTTVPMHSSTS